MTQGQVFVDRAHYNRDDTFMCMLEGTAHLRLVPHVNWNFMYAGKQIEFWSNEKGGKQIVQAQINESPVNLFAVDFGKYPKVHYLEQMYQDDLSAGDCIFIPAYYFYQTAGESTVQTVVDEIKPSAIMIELKYRSGNEMLNAYFDAIEKGVLK